MIDLRIPLIIGSLIRPGLPYQWSCHWLVQSGDGWLGGAGGEQRRFEERKEEDEGEQYLYYGTLSFILGQYLYLCYLFCQKYHNLPQFYKTQRYYNQFNIDKTLFRQGWLEPSELSCVKTCQHELCKKPKRLPWSQKLKHNNTEFLWIMNQQLGGKNQIMITAVTSNYLHSKHYFFSIPLSVFNLFQKKNCINDLYPTKTFKRSLKILVLQNCF